MSKLTETGETGVFSNQFLPPSDLRFLQEQRLWWLAAIPLLLLAYIAMVFLAKRAALRFTNVALLDKIAPERLGFTRHIPLFFFLAGLAMSVLSYAEPAAVSDVPSERATIMLAIDTSISMDASDVKPSRIEGAKEAATEFVDQVPPEINVGLVSFNGIATVRVPPTTNRGSVRAAINSLELGEATAIGEALVACVNSLETFLKGLEGTDHPPAHIVLMSDGTTTVGRDDQVGIDAAQLAGIAVSTISFGTKNGAVTLPSGDVIPVPVDTPALTRIAEETGGDFFAAATTAELKKIYSDIGSAIATEETNVLVGSWFSGRAALLMIISGVLSLVLSRRLP